MLSNWIESVKNRSEQALASRRAEKNQSRLVDTPINQKKFTDDIFPPGVKPERVTSERFKD